MQTWSSRHKRRYRVNQSNRVYYVNRYSNTRSGQAKNIRATSPYLIAAVLIIVSILIFQASRSQPSKNKSTVAGMKTVAVPQITLTSLPAIDSKKPSIPPIRKPDAIDPRIYAKAVLLVDSGSSYPMYMKNERTQVPIASLTKIMTAVIVLEEYNLDTIVTINKTALQVPESTMKLLPGEKIKIRDLLWGLLMVSGNDAANALAEQYPGSKPGQIEPFINAMNKKAQLLGLNDTHFKDPAGLDDSGRSTAYDLAFLTAYALRNQTFTEIVGTAERVVTSVDNRVTHQLKNSNRLVVNTEPLYYPSVIGGKTGFTYDAGHCLIAAAKQNNHLLIGVILNTQRDTKDESARLNKQLLQWGFDSYTWDK